MVDFFTSIEAYFTATPAADDHFAVPKGLGDRRLNQRVSEYGFLAAESEWKKFRVEDSDGSEWVLTFFHLSLTPVWSWCRVRTVKEIL